MIDQKDIDRLLAGRKLIDGIKRPDSETLNTLSSAAKLSTKETVTAAIEYDARNAKAEIAKLMEIEKQSILDAQKALNELGFSDLSEFLKLNKDLCFEEYFECLTITRGKLCKTCPTMACQAFLTKYPCGKGYLAPYADDLTVEVFLENATKGMIYLFWQKKMASICPPGYGWIYGKSREARFDLRWRPELPNNPWKDYETEQQKETVELNEQWKRIK